MNATVSLVRGELTQTLLEAGVPGLRLLEAVSVDDNSRRMAAGEFDVAEMSLATFVRSVSRGAELAGLPVFPGRRFVQAGMLRRRGSGVRTPRDLAGRRVALPQYWLTSSVWQRGVLHDEFDLAAQAVEWMTTRPERAGAGFPPGVRVTLVEGATLPELFAQQRIDAALVPRPLSAELAAAGAENLFADPGAAGLDWFARTGIFPVMHFVAMRSDLPRRAPHAAPALCAAFLRAQRNLHGTAAQGLPPPVGLTANRPALERFLDWAQEQQLVSDRPELGRLFPSDSLSEHASA